MAVNSSTVNYTVSEDRYSLGTDNYTLSMVFTSENTTSAGKTYDASPLPKKVLLVVSTTIPIILVVSFMIFWYSSRCKKGQKAPEAEEERLMTDPSRLTSLPVISSKLTDSSRSNTPVSNKMLQYSAHIDDNIGADDNQIDGCKEKRYSRKATLNMPDADSAFDETSFMDRLHFNNTDIWSPPHAAECSNKSFVTNFQPFISLRNIDEFSHLEKGTKRREIVNNRKATSPFQSDICSIHRSDICSIHRSDICSIHRSDICSIHRSAFLIGKEQSDDDSSYSEDSDLLLEHNLDNKAISCRESEWNECRRQEKVETDILLTSPEKKKDQEETAVVLKKKLEDISQIDTEKIDWNKVFIFLCERLGAEWRLFFLRLYGFSKVKIEMIDDRMSHIEETTRRKPGGNNSQCIIFDQFRAWKASEGTYASHLTICETLEDMNRNDLSHKFKEFMSKLPLVHYDSRSSITANSSDIYNTGHLSDTSFESIVNADMFIGNRFPNFQCSIMHKRYEEICITSERRQEQGDGEEENEMNTEPKSYAFHNSIDKGTQTVAKVHSQPHVQEPKLAGIPSLAERSRGSNGEERKLIKKKFKRKRKKMHKHLYLSTESLSSDTFFIMAKALLESQVKTIPKDMYERFVRNLILDITQETGSSDVTILSLKVTEFQLNLSHQTSKERIYSLYAGEVRLILGNSVFERLSLYVNEARKRIVDKLPTEATTENYVFITYEGKPLLDKIQSQAATATAATTSTAAAARSDFSDCSDISVKEPSSSSSEAN